MLRLQVCTTTAILTGFNMCTHCTVTTSSYLLYGFPRVINIFVCMCAVRTLSLALSVTAVTTLYTRAHRLVSKPSPSQCFSCFSRLLRLVQECMCVCTRAHTLFLRTSAILSFLTWDISWSCSKPIDDGRQEHRQKLYSLCTPD